MKFHWVPILLLCVTPVLAQTQEPAADDEPVVQAPPKGKGRAAAPKAARPQSLADRLQACLEIEDGSKERLDCYDAVVTPKPKAKAAKPKAVTDCAAAKEEDERLACFNGFVERLPKR